MKKLEMKERKGRKNRSKENWKISTTEVHFVNVTEELAQNAINDNQ